MKTAGYIAGALLIAACSCPAPAAAQGWPLPASRPSSRPAFQGETMTGDVSIIALPFFLKGRRVWIYLPPGYGGDTSRRYPVLYMHDGQNLFDAAASYAGEWEVDEACERLIGSGEIPPLIVVGVENAREGRLAEYTPWPDGKYGGGGADAYLKEMATVLKPEIDARYRTLPDAAHTFMAGSSLGGLISAYAGYAYPSTWGGVMALSPSYWWASEKIAAWAAHKPKPPLRFFYQDMGTRERGADPGVEDYIAQLRRVKALALAQGFSDGQDFFSVEAQGHNHSEGAWAARFPFMLRLLFGAGRRP